MKTSTAILLAGIIGGIAGGVIVWVTIDSHGPPAGSLPAVTQKPEPVSRIEPLPPSAPVSSRRAEPMAPAASASAPAVAASHSSDALPARPLDGMPGPTASATPGGNTAIHAVAIQQTALTGAAGSSVASSPAVPDETPAADVTIDDALSFALEAADPYVSEGFTAREDFWGGDLPVKESKAIVHQLYKGNEYWFWMGTASAEAKISVHLYDANGALVEAEAWQKPHKAAARVVPKKTGSHYLIVEIEKSPEERTHWALVYGFR